MCGVIEERLRVTSLTLSLHYGAGIEIYCAPTADARPSWQASMTHIAMEGGCFVLSANQFCRRKDYPPAPEYSLGGFGEVDPPPESVVCTGGSVILSPAGKVLAGPDYEGETVLIADIGIKISSDRLPVLHSCFIHSISTNFAFSGSFENSENSTVNPRKLNEKVFKT